ncbi:DUF4277 domain-containing protein [Streptomyces yangpuensis]|uniref:DUF4277 domain-containing protein n=1 Tax=Streptomyces yangpuensis TaxID=1648182 RepID=UPI00381EC9C4
MEFAPVVERRLGALPASAEFLRRLDVAGIVDGLCPIREVAHLPTVMVANRLSVTAPLVRVGDWAREWAVEEVFGVEPDLLGDDRLARTLDAIEPHLDELVGTVGAQAIGTSKPWPPTPSPTPARGQPSTANAINATHVQPCK